MKLKTRVSVVKLLIALSLYGIQCSEYAHQQLKNISFDQQNYHKKGLISLAFVFDRTGSMYDDLVKVREGATKIFNNTIDNGKPLVNNYILVPFSDPDVGPAFQTKDPEKFLKFLNDITVHGGHDCPEMSVTAIKKALELSLPGSVIYVFTDAEAKDHQMLGEVVQLITRKKIRVNFILTGNCGLEKDFKRRNTYERIAILSSGQIVNINKSDIAKIWDYVKLSINPNRKNIFSVDKLSSGERTYFIQIDQYIDVVVITVSGENIEVEIKDNTGEMVHLTDKNVDVLLNLPSVLSVLMRNPKEGNWSVKVRSVDGQTLRVEAISDYWDEINQQHEVNVIPKVNECSQRIHDCDPQQQCVDLPFGFICINKCKTGFNMTIKGECIDINECINTPFICGIKECRNTKGSYRCLEECPRGFARDAYDICKDINECLISPSICGENDCFNTERSYRCLRKCSRGYNRNSDGDCEDINECLKYPSLCGKEECFNIKGSYSCQEICSRGFRRYNNSQCIDIDECSESSFICGNKECFNVVGSYRCVDKCSKGYYRSDNGYCKDIDECLDGSNNCQHMCKNTGGGYECLCPRGSRLAPDERKCIRTRACVTRDHRSCQYQCNISTGICECPEGYKLHWNEASCIDINECFSGKHACGTRACFNTLGKYHCLNLTCPHGYFPTTDGYCTMQCFYQANQCPARYTKVQYTSISIPRFLPVNTDFLHLKPYIVPVGRSSLYIGCRAYFHPLKDVNHLFGVYQLGDLGVMYNRAVFHHPGFYELRIVSDYLNGFGEVLSRTMFYVFVDVAYYTF